MQGLFLFVFSLFFEKLKISEETEHVTVPAGYLLLFCTLDEKGCVSIRYKDSDGNYGDM